MNEYSVTYCHPADGHLPMTDVFEAEIFGLASDGDATFWTKGEVVATYPRGVHPVVRKTGTTEPKRAHVNAETKWMCDEPDEAPDAYAFRVKLRPDIIFNYPSGYSVKAYGVTEGADGGYYFYGSDGKVAFELADRNASVASLGKASNKETYDVVIA